MILAKEKYDYYDLEQISRPSKKINKKLKYKFKLKPRALIVVAVLVVFLMGLALAARYAQIATTGYQINSLKKQATAIQNENDQLEVQIQKLESLDRIEKVAVEKLGMQKPTDAAGVQFLADETTLDSGSEKANKQVASQGQVNKTDNKKNSFLDAIANLVGWKNKAEAKTAD